MRARPMARLYIDHDAGSYVVTKAGNGIRESARFKSWGDAMLHASNAWAGVPHLAFDRTKPKAAPIDFTRYVVSFDRDGILRYQLKEGATDA